jgi:hypothetical protein
MVTRGPIWSFDCDLLGERGEGLRLSSLIIQRDSFTDELTTHFLGEAEATLCAKFFILTDLGY